ncbi:MAG: RnfABCDGE type electron transport complex subunit D [Clostridiales bacterium]|nr:RnfABCDGE type electron transport complex subunit D [Clostridiales bacterium]MBR6255005.1 RnfABCDGE type electron transport complex subunit D [Clostridiales bacterium]
MKLQVSHSPHVRDKATTQSIMRDVIIALLPATFAGWYYFGIRAVLITLLSIASCVLFEFICRKVMKRNNTIYDLSAVVTGLLLAMNLPVSLPPYMVVIGAAFAIVVVKQMFGGLGNNFVNPAIAARIFLVIAFPKAMTCWTVRTGSWFSFKSVDAVSSATPLTKINTPESPSLWNLFIGDKAGCIGEVCIAALLIGALYLILRHVIRIWIPLAYVGTFFVLSFLFGHNNVFNFSGDLSCLCGWSELFHESVYMLMSGGLILGAFFMATDYVTSPLTTKGKIIFGIGCGILTFLIRYYGNMAEGVSFSIILMNILTPHIDDWTMGKPFGEVKESAKV